MPQRFIIRPRSGEIGEAGGIGTEGDGFGVDLDAAVEAAGRVKTHQRQRVGRREKRRLRLIGERDAQRERAMGGKFAHQSVGQF
ncbi:MAG: hypothetical protein WA156_13175 [Methylocystis silviterrae]